jgi:general secretion pathway protein D
MRHFKIKKGGIMTNERCFGGSRWLFVLLVFTAFPASAQFTKLQDKYGTPTSLPLQQKEPSGQAGTPSGGGKQGEEGEIVVPDGMIMLNGVDVDIKDMIKLIATTTGRNFILDDKVRGKITIISEKPMTYDMAYEAFLSSLEANGFTIVNTPAGLLSVIPQKDSIQKPTDLYKESSPNTDLFITRIISLNNISANEIATVIKPMIGKNGNMFAYPTTNSLVITDTGSNIDHVLKLIKELDQEGPQEMLDIIPIVNADAKDIASKVTQIFDTGSKDDAAVRRRQVFRPRGQPEMEDIQAISKVIADDRTNSIIIMGTKRSILKVRELISRLDRSISGVEGTIHVYYLKNATAKEMAEVLSNLVGSSSSSKTTGTAKTANARAAGSTGASTVELEGGVKVTADEGTNSLIITASPKDFTTLVDKVISKLDIVRPQVYLEAVIMSLDVTKTRTLGVSGNGGVASGALNFFGGIMPLATSSLSSIAQATGGLGAGVISTETIDFTLSDGSTVSIPAVSGIIQALETDADANVLSTPSILTLDNEEASIQVGQDVPVPSGTTVSSGVTTFNVQREEVGIILKITPQISESDTVKLKLEQEISSVAAVDASLGPTLDSKKVTTVVVAKNKQTVVLGGLIDDTNLVSTAKVPFLGDVPVLGSLFRNRTQTKTKTNLIVFITPYIIRERADYMAILKKKIEERNAFIDLNYGAGQRKQIRQAIQNHAMDLLEFKCKNADLGDPCGGVYYDNVPSVSTTSGVTEDKIFRNEYNPRKRLKEGR